MVKMNSLPGSNMWYSVTICIDLIQIRLNSLQQTKYCIYLIERSSEKGKLNKFLKDKKIKIKCSLNLSPQ